MTTQHRETAQALVREWAPAQTRTDGGEIDGSMLDVLTDRIEAALREAHGQAVEACWSRAVGADSEPTKGACLRREVSRATGLRVQYGRPKRQARARARVEARELRAQWYPTEAR